MSLSTLPSDVRCRLFRCELASILWNIFITASVLRSSRDCEREKFSTQQRDEGERRAYLCLLLPVSAIVLTVTADLTAHLSASSLPPSPWTPTTNQITGCTLVGVASWLLSSRGAGPTGVTVLIRWNCRGVLKWVWLGRPSANNKIITRHHVLLR